MVAWFLKPRTLAIGSRVDGVFLLDGCEYGPVVTSRSVDDGMWSDLPLVLDSIYKHTGYVCVAVHAYGGFEELYRAAKMMRMELDELQIGMVSFCVVISEGSKDVYRNRYELDEMIQKKIVKGMVEVRDICIRTLAKRTLLVYGAGLTDTEDDKYIKPIVEEIRYTGAHVVIGGGNPEYHSWVRRANELTISKL